MSSFTGDSANTTQENPFNFRTSLSTTKKKNPNRKIIQITRLDLRKELKELEQVSREYPPFENQTAEKPPLLEIREEESEEPQTKNKENVEDSFEHGFAALSLITPAKKPPKIVSATDNAVNFVTPQAKLPVLKPANQVKQSLAPRFATPMRDPPRIQCTVDMKSGLNTPINKLSKPPGPFRRIRVNRKEYVVLNQLGRGGSCEVFHCFDPKEETHCALKCVPLTNPMCTEGLIKEIEMLQRLQDCDRVIKLHDYEIDSVKQVLLVALEIGSKDLGKILKELPPQLPIYLLLYYWMEMLLAVKQMHSKGIIHADLKPANFLQVDNRLKLIDFGISRMVEGDMTSIIKPVAEGSYHYISPEALNNVGTSPSEKSRKYKIGFKSDVWSLGCILYQLVYRRTPFQNVPNTFAKLAAICDPAFEISYPEVTGKVPKILVNTIRTCLDRDMRSRPSIDDLIQDYKCFL